MIPFTSLAACSQAIYVMIHILVFYLLHKAQERFISSVLMNPNPGRRPPSECCHNLTGTIPGGQVRHRSWRRRVYSDVCVVLQFQGCNFTPNFRSNLAIPGLSKTVIEKPLQPNRSPSVAPTLSKPPSSENSYEVSPLTLKPPSDYLRQSRLRFHVEMIPLSAGYKPRPSPAAGHPCFHLQKKSTQVLAIYLISITGTFRRSHRRKPRYPVT